MRCAARLPLLCAALLLLCSMPASAWWAKGHMAVALIAQRHMSDAAVAKTNLSANVLCKTGPYPKSPDMVQSASWPDDIKEIGFNTMSSWHFINTPYYTDDFRLPVSPLQSVNVVTVIPMLLKALKNPQATSEIIAQSASLLIHFMGDIHQPLHNVNIFSHKYPNSDLGGNMQTVTIDDAGTKMKLHMYWDSIAEGNAGDDVPRPLFPDDYKDLNNFVDYLEATYASTLTDADKTLQDPAKITVETYDLAIKYAYPGADDGATLTEEYKANAKKVAERQVLLAGYRLALMLNETMKSVNTSAITEGMKNVEAEVPTTDNTTRVNHYVQKGLSSGATAGIAVVLFCVGVIIAAIVVAVLQRCGRTKDQMGQYQELGV
ncbi:putative 3'-nucleotidase/nuclease precursor [Leptomonas pyrrhocoris]|uniref:Putative 3'-nucleotidase/nuclease n=1 Tax=Leptomonas pyrrhocoris TaxID=157538 RepID=A0A0M9FR56_LEPPY|nr:putative 3'-nucleotidase/nuclease precursor [Leptomonas pyrrhocoris]XP_015652820.1 putative 3'-nucleotidase/nuclease precursor [Leptomonas pyrrhocoris]KPA74380.1 putative 3'-nucleotidase/nuclease precursor [Leptomonas pyrrhocoris]KPA74381.1 putative 3'-nucleotidase/nuclease precursor [Leptomonas pyrrhocoris]|eukprot:XP_015652819.1 putative 3'-nucleotidase/nuclease precursor [Leptomonas pyrrhocoris]